MYYILYGSVLYGTVSYNECITGFMLQCPHEMSTGYIPLSHNCCKWSNEKSACNHGGEESDNLLIHGTVLQRKQKCYHVNAIQTAVWQN